MSTQEERNKIRDNLSTVIPLCCNGNKSAEEYMRMVAYAARVVDDIVDKDYSGLTKEKICKAFYYLFSEIPSNTFFTQNAGFLLGVHKVAFNAWMDSMDWENGNTDQKRYAGVIKGFINEICPLVALLTGGYDFMRKVSLVIRESFIEEVR